MVMRWFELTEEVVVETEDIILMEVAELSVVVEAVDQVEDTKGEAVLLVVIKGIALVKEALLEVVTKEVGLLTEAPSVQNTEVIVHEPVVDTREENVLLPEVVTKEVDLPKEAPSVQNTEVIVHEPVVDTKEENVLLPEVVTKEVELLRRTVHEPVVVIPSVELDSQVPQELLVHHTEVIEMGHKMTVLKQTDQNLTANERNEVVMRNEHMKLLVTEMTREDPQKLGQAVRRKMFNPQKSL